MHAGPDQHCPAPTSFIHAMSKVFEELRKADEAGETTSANSAETLANVLEMVRQHKVGISDS